MQRAIKRHAERLVKIKNIVLKAVYMVQMQSLEMERAQRGDQRRPIRASDAIEITTGHRDFDTLVITRTQYRHAGTLRKRSGQGRNLLFNPAAPGMCNK